MSRLRGHSFSISIDSYGAGPNQDLENPLGVGGLKLRRDRRAGGTDKSAPGRVCTAMTRSVTRESLAKSSR